MVTLLLTIIGPTGSIDVELPAEIPIRILLSKLVSLCVSDQQTHSRQWALWLAGTHRPLDNVQSLFNAGVVDGAVLMLRYDSPSIQQQEDKPIFQLQTLYPGEESGGIGVRWHNLP